MRFVPCIVRERQLRPYGHVARFPDADPAHQILSARKSREWSRPMGRPRASWLQQVIGISRRWGWARHLPGDGQTEAPDVPVESGRGALLRLMLPYLT